MRESIFLLAGLAVAGCSSSTDLVRDGNPKACAKSDVVRNVIAEIRKSPTYPISQQQISDFKVDPKKWVDQVDIDITNASTTNVDAANQVIECIARVEFMADDVPVTKSGSVQYRLMVDQMNDSTIVMVSTKPYAAFAGMISLVAQPDIKEPLRLEQQASQARNDAIIAAERRRYEEFEAARAERERVAEQEATLASNAQPTATWTAAEAREIEKARDLNSQCRGGSGNSSETNAACEKRDALYAKLHSSGICYGRDNEYGYQMDFHRCEANSL